MQQQSPRIRVQQLGTWFILLPLASDFRRGRPRVANRATAFRPYCALGNPTFSRTVLAARRWRRGTRDASARVGDGIETSLADGVTTLLAMAVSLGIETSQSRAGFGEDLVL